MRTFLSTTKNTPLVDSIPHKTQGHDNNDTNSQLSIISSKSENTNKKFYQKGAFWAGFTGGSLGIGLAIPVFGVSPIVFGAFLFVALVVLIYYCRTGDGGVYLKGALCGFIALVSIAAIIIGAGWLEPILAALASLEPLSFLPTSAGVLNLEISSTLGKVLLGSGAGGLLIELLAGIYLARRGTQYTVALEQDLCTEEFKNLYRSLCSFKISEYIDNSIPGGDGILKFQYSPNTETKPAYGITVWTVVDVVNRKDIINIQRSDDYNNASGENKLGICIDPSSGAILSVYRNGVLAEENTLLQAELDQLLAVDAKVKEIQNSESYTKHLNSGKSEFDALNQLKQEMGSKFTNFDSNTEE